MVLQGHSVWSINLRTQHETPKLKNLLRELSSLSLSLSLLHVQRRDASRASVNRPSLDDRSILYTTTIYYLLRTVRPPRTQQIERSTTRTPYFVSVWGNVASEWSHVSSHLSRNTEFDVIHVENDLRARYIGIP